MEYLKKNSIHIPGTIVVCWPQHGNKTETLDMRETASKFNGAFCVNNSTIAFILNHDVYVTPYTQQAMSAIRAAGLTEAGFYVPFSNWDYPVAEKERWDQLWAMARAEWAYEYEKKCEEWCDEHHIRELSDKTLERCFRIPREGVPVRHPYFEDTVYPACNETSIEPDKLGHYCSNNGKVVFVYRDGHTYVVRGYWILGQLDRAGYERGSLFVPFSNGEEITNPFYATLWAQVSK